MTICTTYYVVHSMSVSMWGYTLYWTQNHDFDTLTKCINNKKTVNYVTFGTFKIK